jgi:hypothetical protein
LPNDNEPPLATAVREQFQLTLADLTPKFDARPEPQFKLPEYRHLNVAQNVLRTCMEVCLNEMLPYSEITPVELATRLASYALSALPVEAQESAAAHFVSIFESAHRSRIASGIRLSTEWVTPGIGLHENFPERTS